MKLGPAPSRSAVIDGRTIPAPPIEHPRAPPQDSPTFSQVLQRLAGEVDRGEAVVSHALRASPSGDDSRSMIALQAGVYRYVEAVDLCTRLVDRAAGAVKTTLQSQ
jgi:hypothetical protein